uniref:FF domain-containing protein n=1 Tax=Meloidogyne javanica TaxID=6303 RepID=A0A915LQA6_MELJA
KKKLEESFVNLLQSITPPIEPETEWEQILELIKDEEQYKAIEDDQLKEQLFNFYISIKKIMAKSTKQQQPSDSKMVSSELFILTYGALVNDLISDLESPEEVNRQLDKIGYN